MNKTVKKSMVFAAMAIAICAIGLRIYYVNAAAAKIDIEHYSMGEWVDLNGAFLEGDYEDTGGYSVRVNAAEIISYNEYIERYGSGGAEAIDGGDEKSVVVLGVEAKNIDNTEGSLYMFQWKLVPERGNEYLLYDTYLWSKGEANIKGSSGEDHFITLLPNSDYAMHIPFAVNTTDEDARYQYNLLSDSSLELTIANAPVKKIIKIVASSG